MTPVLRTVHRYTWFALALLLPAVWVAALLSRQDMPVQKPVRLEPQAALPIVLESRRSGPFLLNLRSDSVDRQLQLELFIQRPIEQPNTMLWAMTPGDSTGILLGSLGTRGVYRYSLDGIIQEQALLRIRLTDQLQQHILREITFQNIKRDQK